MKFHISFFLLLITGLSAQAFMSGSILFVEPSIGYRNETIKLTDKSNAESQIKIGTPVYGLKIGYRTALAIDFNLAADYSSGKADMSPLVEKNNFSHKMISAQLGINALGLMKIYLGYAFSNELQFEDGLLNLGYKLSGPAYIAGIQYRLFSSVFLGAQYNLNQFNSISGAQFTNGDKVDQYFNKLDLQDYSFSLSTSF